MQVLHNYPQSECGHGHVTLFKFWDPLNFGTREDRHFKFDTQVDHD